MGECLWPVEGPRTEEKVLDIALVKPGLPYISQLGTDGEFVAYGQGVSGSQRPFVEVERFAISIGKLRG